MKRLSKKEAIRRHRLMWNWIADETIRGGRLVDKREAFEHFGWDSNNVTLQCWCCEYKYTHPGHCANNCILVWPGAGCVVGSATETALFSAWCTTKNPEKSAALARRIAELPEREDKTDEH